ncbi:NUDIX domain-containing protein [Emticicia sp. BO119]|uniref:NUDIX hydrolase n=1 Tax=Emticicia sp. BO119 TaxID=2757768 RepID=UPI0015F053F1|nr:NUDIX domain-containing protein [Emticicia sp. BO119]MBA4850015.1 NUDIX domain-containing protein [Emticicia sp. BO119]
MFFVATGLLFDKNNRLLIYLRDDKPTISFPNHWDLFGGIIEEGESPEYALVREVKEEIGIDLISYYKFREYYSDSEDRPNWKYVFFAKIDYLPEELILNEGQRLTSINLKERFNYKFANILGRIIDDFANSELYCNYILKKA